MATKERTKADLAEEAFAPKQPPQPLLTPAQVSKIDYERARAQKTKADAASAELELAQMRKQLVATVDVVAAWEEVLVGLRAKLLSIPTKASAVLANEDRPTAIKQYLEEEIGDALHELSSYRPKVDPSKQSISEPESGLIEAKKKPGRPTKAAAAKKKQVKKAKAQP